MDRPPGAGSGDWFNDANWTNHVPTPLTDAFINNGGRAQINRMGATAQSLTLGENVGDSGTVSVDGTMMGSLVITPGVSDEGPAPVQGAIYVGKAGRGTLTITHGGIVASGYGYIAALSGGGVTKDSNGTVAVDGEHSSWTVNGPSGNNLLSVGGMGAYDGGTGLLSITNGGHVTVNHHNGAPYAARVCTSGTLTGNSTITLAFPEDPENYYAASLAVRGTIAPTRELKIDGTLLYTPNGSTVCDVMATDNPNEDHINVAEQMYLNGRLSVTMKGDFSSAPTRYTLLHSEDDLILNTIFSAGVSITYPTGQGWSPQITYDYDGGNVYLDRVYDLNP